MTPDQAAAELSCLSAGERDVLILTCKGFSTKDAAEFRKVTRKTIETQRSRVKNKLDMTLIEAAVLAAKAGWV